MACSWVFFNSSPFPLPYPFISPSISVFHLLILLYRRPIYMIFNHLKQNNEEWSCIHGEKEEVDNSGTEMTNQHNVPAKWIIWQGKDFLSPPLCNSRVGWCIVEPWTRKERCSRGATTCSCKWDMTLEDSWHLWDLTSTSLGLFVYFFQQTSFAGQWRVVLGIPSSLETSRVKERRTNVQCLFGAMEHMHSWEWRLNARLRLKRWWEVTTSFQWSSRFSLFLFPTLLESR